MECPPEISRIVAEVIGVGILRTRAAAWAGDAERSAIEADHIHNLPHMLHDFEVEKLKYYWNVERLDFLARSERASLSEFESLWNELGRHADTMADSASTT